MYAHVPKKLQGLILCGTSEKKEHNKINLT